MQEFGRLPDGTIIHIARLGSANGLQADVLTLGGTLHGLTLPVRGQRIPLVLRLNDVAAYLADRMYLGRLIGRYANRIAGAKFELDGHLHRLTRNEGENSLHGGDSNFGLQVWDVVEVTEGEGGHIELSHRSSAGAGGYPGNLEVRARIAVHGDTLSLHFEASTDAATPINFTWHPYFNLSGDSRVPIDAHRLRLAAGRYLPVDSSWLAVGKIAPVAGTPFDFRNEKALRSPPGAPQRGPDPVNYYWVLNGEGIAAELYSPESGVRMVVRTNLPGLQVYDGFALREQHADMHAVCIEPGNFPDAPNHAAFPSSVLEPGTLHRSFLSYSFIGR